MLEPVINPASLANSLTLSPLCKAVAHALAPLLIVAKSDITGCTAISHVQSTLVEFIVFMLVQLTRASCFVLS